jgi:hypothetical protein
MGFYSIGEIFLILFPVIAVRRSPLSPCITIHNIWVRLGVFLRFAEKLWIPINTLGNDKFITPILILLGSLNTCPDFNYISAFDRKRPNTHLLVFVPPQGGREIINKDIKLMPLFILVSVTIKD